MIGQGVHLDCRWRDSPWRPSSTKFTAPSRVGYIPRAGPGTRYVWLRPLTGLCARPAAAVLAPPPPNTTSLVCVAGVSPASDEGILPSFLSASPRPRRPRDARARCPRHEEGQSSDVTLPSWRPYGTCLPGRLDVPAIALTLYGAACPSWAEPKDPPAPTPLACTG